MSTYYQQRAVTLLIMRALHNAHHLVLGSHIIMYKLHSAILFSCLLPIQTGTPHSSHALLPSVAKPSYNTLPISRPPNHSYASSICFHQQ